MVVKAGFPGQYYRGAFETANESEGSGSSGRIDMDITASEDSCAPTRKCNNFKSSIHDASGVPMQVMSLDNMSTSERKDLIIKLRSDLEHIQTFRKKIEFQATKEAVVSTSSDILSCSNRQNASRVENFQKSSIGTSGLAKKVNHTSKKMLDLSRSSSGRFESSSIQAPPQSTANILLMKQCETLLKRLMSHQHSWVFNSPVDVVKLNIPDYLTVIKHPMDLGTVKKKMSSGAYSSPKDFLADVRLTFSNAMTYNPPGNDVHIMADTLSKFFEVRWKAIEKKLSATTVQPLPREKLGVREDRENIKPIPPMKKRKTFALSDEVIVEPVKPVKPVMSSEEKHNLSQKLESLLGELPVHIIEFLKEHSSNGKDSSEDEIEIDIDDLSDETLYTLQKLLDDYMQEKQKNQLKDQPCEIELLNQSGLSNSSVQHCKGNDPAEEDVDIGGDEPPVSSYPAVEIEKDKTLKSSKFIGPEISSDSDSSSSESESCGGNVTSSMNASKVPEIVDSGAQLTKKTSGGKPFNRNQSASGLDQLEHTSQQKPSSVESDCRKDGDSTPNEKQVSPGKLYRAALLKNRFADAILKAREKTLSQNDKGDPEKLRQEREELELQKKKEKARIQAEAKAAEDARMRAEAAAAAEARRQREVDREAARQAVLKITKTVDINGTSLVLEEMLKTGPPEHIPSSVDETSPDHSHDGGLGSFMFGGSNPLEQLGLYMKEDEEEEEAAEAHNNNTLPDHVNDVEEGEIDLT